MKVRGMGRRRGRRRGDGEGRGSVDRMTAVEEWGRKGKGRPRLGRLKGRELRNGRRARRVEAPPN